MLNIKELLSGEIQRMSHIERYSSYPMIRRENVAEHSFFVAFYGWIIARDMQCRGFPVNLATVLEKAIIHDVDECLTGDILRPIKYSVPGLYDAIENAAKDMLGQLSEDLGIGKLLPLLWSNSKNGDLEGHIVYFADFIAVLSYLWQEDSFGNKRAAAIAKECMQWFYKIMNNMPAPHSEALAPYFAQVEAFAKEAFDDVC
jgi:5'-deoxynucleotidase YfbR-like HD superfamily hydrolase